MRPTRSPFLFVKVTTRGQIPLFHHEDQKRPSSISNIPLTNHNSTHINTQLYFFVMSPHVLCPWFFPHLSRTSFSSIPQPSATCPPPALPPPFSPPPAPSLLLDICPTGPGISSYQKQHKSITSVFPPLAYREGGKNTINCSHLLCMIFFFFLSASVSPWLTSLWVRINHLRDAVGLVIKSGTESERLRVNVHGFTTTEKMNCCFSLVTDLDSFAVLSALNPSPTFPPHL